MGVNCTRGSGSLHCKNRERIVSFTAVAGFAMLVENIKIYSAVTGFETLEDN